MAGMSKAELVTDLKASLQDAASLFTAHDADFERHLDQAALDLPRVRPRVVPGELTLQPGQNAYPAPADFVAMAEPFWGRRERHRRQPWENGWPGRLPRAKALVVSGTAHLWLDPAPSAAQLSALGATYTYTYFTAHALGVTEAGTTVRPADRGLLLLRAQAEAMKELAMRNHSKRVALRDGVSSGPRNGTPAALHAQLLRAFERGAA